MNRTASKKVVALVLALLLVMSSVLVACNPTTPQCTTHVDLDNDGKCDVCGADMPKSVEITVTAEKNTINFDETLPVKVEVKNAEDTSYTWSYSKENVVVVEDNIIRVVKTDMIVDIFVVLTATSNADKTKSADFALTVKAPVVEGQVGELTSEMIQTIGNSNITVTGKLTDHYIDYAQPYNSYDSVYNMTVKMNDKEWQGTWSAEGSTEEISNHYRKGSDDNLVVNENGEKGNALEELYINKDNQVASKVITNSSSIPAIWQSQHLWNHLSQLNVNKFVYDAENEVYSYEYDATNVDELYFLTYLSYSLTPVLTETLYKVYLKIENGAITQLIAQTEPVLYPEGAEEPDATSYSVIELTFSDIGTTEIEQPATYEAGENSDVLQKALDAMKQAKNYTFHAVDTQQSAPATDPGDYEISASLSSGTANLVLGDKTVATGSAGLQGWVTEGEILLCETTKYDYAMDDKLYRLEYYGYKQVEEGYYDEFDYDSTNNAYYGVKRMAGNMFEQMPGFDFSVNLFEYVRSKTVNGVTNYTFVLRENNISKDIAMELGIYYAQDSSASLQSNFELVVNENGVVSVKYPYELTAGYSGYITVNYYDLGTTQMPEEGLFDNYVQRQIPQTWSSTETKYYSPDCSALTSQTVNSDIAFADAYGTKYQSAQFPQAALFYNVFGDSVYGPFYNYDQTGEDAEGNAVYRKYISLTVEIDDYDENVRITAETYNATMNKLLVELAKLGFVVDNANTDTTGGATGYSDKTMTFINDDLGLQIRVENNRTKYFWIDIFNAGDFQLN